MRRMSNHKFPVLPKQLYHIKMQRFLKLSEIIEIDGVFTCLGSDLESSGVKTVSNTPEEIRDHAIEVCDRLEGRWQPHSEDAALQKRFWDIYSQRFPAKEMGNIAPPISSEFLMKHLYLLD